MTKGHSNQAEKNCKCKANDVINLIESDHCLTYVFSPRQDFFGASASASASVSCDRNVGRAKNETTSVAVEAKKSR